MRTLFGDLTAMKDHNSVSLPDGGQPMRDHDGGASAHELHDCSLEPRLGLGVDVCGGLVENQERRIAIQGPRERDQLALAGAEVRAAFFHPGVDAEWPPLE